jgi:uncharacterized membrane protein YhaH (DUF805 family)
MLNDFDRALHGARKGDTTMSKYGKLGWDVGSVGRWTRLVFGILLTALVVLDFIGGSHTHSPATNLLTGILFVGIVAIYFAGYMLIVERVKDKNPWIPTVIFVFPAVYFGVINAMFVPSELSFGVLVGLPGINHPLSLAMVLYFGLSLTVQFFSRYGGCEVIAIQNLILKKECSSYCVGLLPLDFVEKLIVDRFADPMSSTDRPQH